MANKESKKECNVPGCTNRAQRKGICAEHIGENYALKCTVEDCEKDVFAKGRCQPHYKRLYRRRNGEAAPEQARPVRNYGQKRFVVYTRIPQEAAEVILKKAGRKDGMYELAAEILTNWAARHAA